MMVFSIPYFNIFGVALSIITFYGLQTKNICLLQSMLIPNLYEVIMIVLYFIGFFIKLKTSYEVKNKNIEIVISYALVTFSIVQTLIQIYISINLYKLILKYYGRRTTSNENEVIYIYGVEESNHPEEDPLPAYTPPINKLPSYSETQSDATLPTLENSNTNEVSSASENISIVVTPPDESNSTLNITTSATNITTQDITTVTHDNISEISTNSTPPPYSIYPTNS
eukprot:jgi/Orpsp1_1/1177374/evm.model.c7180000061216.1